MRGKKGSWWLQSKDQGGGWRINQKLKHKDLKATMRIFVLKKQKVKTLKVLSRVCYNPVGICKESVWLQCRECAGVQGSTQGRKWGHPGVK